MKHVVKYITLSLLIGFVCSFFIVACSTIFSFPQWLVSVLYFPFLVSSYVAHGIIWPLCHFSQVDMCYDFEIGRGILLYIKFGLMMLGGILWYGGLCISLVKLGMKIKKYKRV